MISLKLLVLCAVSLFSESEQLGDDPFSKRHPLPLGIASRVSSAFRVNIEFLHLRSSAWLQMLPNSLSAPYFYFLLQGWNEFFKPSFLDKTLHGENLLESLCPFVGEEDSRFSLFTFYFLCFLSHFSLRKIFLVLGFFSHFSLNVLHNVFNHFV